MTKFKETVGFLWDVAGVIWGWLAFGVVQKCPQSALAVIIGLAIWAMVR